MEILYTICCKVVSSVKPLTSEASSELFFNTKHGHSSEKKSKPEAKTKTMGAGLGDVSCLPGGSWGTDRSLMSWNLSIHGILAS